MKEINLDKNFKKVTTIAYDGPSLSLNKFYAGGHFSIRLGIKKKYKKIFEDIFENNNELRFIDKFYINIRFNNRVDTDNQVGLIKVFVDTLRSSGFIKDDNKNYFKGLSIFYDTDLEKNTVEMDIYEILEDD